MRGKDEQQLRVFSYISPEERVPQDHPLRSLRTMTDEALRLRATSGRGQSFPESQNHETYTKPWRSSKSHYPFFPQPAKVHP